MQSHSHAHRSHVSSWWRVTHTQRSHVMKSPWITQSTHISERRSVPLTHRGLMYPHITPDEESLTNRELMYPQALCVSLMLLLIAGWDLKTSPSHFSLHQPRIILPCVNHDYVYFIWTNVGWFYRPLSVSLSCWTILSSVYSRPTFFTPCVELVMSLFKIVW